MSDRRRHGRHGLHAVGHTLTRAPLVHVHAPLERPLVAVFVLDVVRVRVRVGLSLELVALEQLADRQVELLASRVHIDVGCRSGSGCRGCRFFCCCYCC